MASKRGLDGLRAAIRAVPEDRLLVESDVSAAADARAATCRAVALVADVRGWSPAETAARTAANAREWLRHRDRLPASYSWRDVKDLAHTSDVLVRTVGRVANPVSARLNI